MRRAREGVTDDLVRLLAAAVVGFLGACATDRPDTDVRTDYPGREGERVGVATYSELTMSFDEDGRATEMIWEYYAD